MSRSDHTLRLPVRVKVYEALPKLPPAQPGDYARTTGRNLYDRWDCRYVGLAEIRERIIGGLPVRVVERTTGEDVTVRTVYMCLGQLIEADPSGVSLQLLYQLIQNYAKKEGTLT